MTGYVRKDTTNNIADGNVINAADLDSEFDGVQAAFNSSTGHTHDGSSAEGAPITKLGPVQDVTVSTTVLGVKTTNTVDLGTSSLKFKDFYLAGNASIGGTLGVTNTATFTGAVIFNGNTTIGDADTDTITQAASYVTGTQLKSAKTATNTLSLAAYDVDGTAYTNLITLTASNTPTLALTSTGVGTINNMSIGATTASTGAFTTLSASSTVTLSGGTENGVAYLNGSKVLTTGSALTFDGSALTVSASVAGASLTSSGAYSYLAFSNSGGATKAGLILTNSSGILQSRAETLAWTNYDASSEYMRIASATGGVGAVGIGYSTLTSVGNNGLAVLGNVGIGTSSPAYKLQVANNGNFNTTVNVSNTTAGTSSYARFLSISDGGNASFGMTSTTYTDVTSAADSLLINASGASGGIVFAHDGVGKMLLDSSGNLGLGVTPSAWFSSYKAIQISTNGSLTSNTDFFAISNNAYTNVSANDVYLAAGYAGRYRHVASSGQHQWYTAPSGTAGGTITFTQAMTLDASGNLGVGATSPATKLHISTDGTYDPLRLQSTQSGYARSWTIGPNVGVNGFFVIRDSTAGENRLAIDSSGNLGLGVTPSAWGTAYSQKAVQVGPVGSVSSLSASSSNQQLTVGNNCYFDGTNWKYITSDTSTRYFQYQGLHAWYTAASGTAGNAITFTQAMTLDASGNLGVGSTSPNIGGVSKAITLNTTNGTSGAIYEIAVNGTNYAYLFANASNTVLSSVQNLPLLFATNNIERARFDIYGNLIQKGATTQAGIKPSALANNESISTVNSATYTITLGTSAKLFWIALGNGDAALVFTSYLSSSITFLGITPTNIVASASPTSAQLGISKSANSHDIVIKTGSALASTAAAWQMGVLSSTVA